MKIVVKTLGLISQVPYYFIPCIKAFDFVFDMYPLTKL